MQQAGDHGALRACVLAGGLGLRLRSALPDQPKALARVRGRPFLDYVLRLLASRGVRDVTLCTGYRSEAVRAFAGDGEAWGLRVDHSTETQPLGTGGALRLAIERFPDAEFLVLNGDSFLDLDLDRLVVAHRSSGAAATMAVRRVADAGRYGTVAVDGRGRVTAFREKSGSGQALINAGVYVLRRSAIESLTPGALVSLERDVFPRLVGAPDGGIATVAFDGWFVDIGIPEDLAAVDADPGPLLRALQVAAPC